MMMKRERLLKLWFLIDILKFYKEYTFRGGKGKPGAKKGKKVNARKESYDLIVNIDIQEWNLTTEQVLEWIHAYYYYW